MVRSNDSFLQTPFAPKVIYDSLLHHTPTENSEIVDSEIRWSTACEKTVNGVMLVRRLPIRPSPWVYFPPVLFFLFWYVLSCKWPKTRFGGQDFLQRGISVERLHGTWPFILPIVDLLQTFLGLASVLSCNWPQKWQILRARFFTEWKGCKWCPNPRRPADSQSLLSFRSSVQSEETARLPNIQLWDNCLKAPTTRKCRDLKKLIKVCRKIKKHSFWSSVQS